MKNVTLLIATIVISLAAIFGIGFLFSRTPQSTSVTLDRAVVEADLTNVQGATESAKLTVVEFSDLQCPACRAAQPLVKQLMQEFGSQVTFAFRHFPLESIHPNARAAAIAAEAAALQNAFWPYHDLLFEKQDEWAQENDETKLLALFSSYAASLQLNTEQFVADVAKPEVAAKVSADAAAASQLNLNSTPTFIVNGQVTPTVELRSTIESQLNAQ